MRAQVILVALFILLPCVRAQEAQEKVVYIIGTAHVFDIEEKIERKIIELEPDAVAVELDSDRLNSLLSGAKSAGEIGEIEVSVGNVNPPEKVELSEDELMLLMTMAAIQSQMASSFQAYSGEDMLAGIAAASTLGVPVYPIDSHITTTMEGLTKGMTAMTQRITTGDAGYGTISLLTDMIKAFIKIAMGAIFSFARSPVVSLKFILSSILGSLSALRADPSIINVVLMVSSLFLTLPTTLAIGSSTGIEGMRGLFAFMPEIYDSMLASREAYMADRIAEISETHDRIVVITGAAHLTGLTREVESRMPGVRVESMTFLDLF